MNYREQNIIIFPQKNTSHGPFYASKPRQLYCDQKPAKTTFKLPNFSMFAEEFLEKCGKPANRSKHLFSNNIRPGTIARRRGRLVETVESDAVGRRAGPNGKSGLHQFRHHIFEAVVQLDMYRVVKATTTENKQWNHLYGTSAFKVKGAALI